MPSAAPLYHEHQRRLCCGAHTLNNLYQKSWIDVPTMDQLANQLNQLAATQGIDTGSGSWFSSAYRSIIPGLGSYDVLVLVEALKTQRAHFSQHLLANAQLDNDLRALGALLSTQEGKKTVKGIILNHRSRNLAMRWLLDGRHWLALIPSPSLAENEEDEWYDVDSKLPAPALVGGIPELLAYIKKNIMEEDGQAFVVSEDKTEDEGLGKEKATDQGGEMM